VRLDILLGGAGGAAPLFMSTQVAPLEVRPPLEDRLSSRARAYRAIVPVGRVLFALVFLMALPSHFSPAAAAYAAAQGVPASNVLVPLAGILAGLGALSVALGLRARVGAWLIVIFLVPVTLWMHSFWRETDPMMVELQLVHFMKNLSILGGALLIAYFGGGPVSIDRLRAQRPRLKTL
jgi:putative oxidoreductase